MSRALLCLLFLACGDVHPHNYVQPVQISSSVYSVDDVDAGVRCYVWAAVAADRGGISCVRIGGAP